MEALSCFKNVCFRSVVAITCALHAQGPRFEPGRKQVLFSSVTNLVVYQKFSLARKVCRNLNNFSLLFSTGQEVNASKKHLICEVPL